MVPIDPSALIAAVPNLRNSYQRIHLIQELLKYGCPAQVTRVAAGRRLIRPNARDPEAVAGKALKSISDLIIGSRHFRFIFIKKENACPLGQATAEERKGAKTI